MKKEKPLAAERKNAHNVIDIQTYFVKFQKVIVELDIASENI